MSHWFHRNPIKATSQVDFEKRTFPSSPESNQICSLLRQTRVKLLEAFSDPSHDSTSVQTELDTYVSLLHGFLTDVSGNTAGDSKLRYSVIFKWSHSLGVQITSEEQDVIFELCNMLINAAIWYTKHAAYIAAVTNEPSDKEAKEVHTSLRAAAGLFKHVQESEIKRLLPSTKIEVAHDLNEIILSTYINQCKAEAQEITIARAIELKHSASLICSIANDTSNLFTAAADALKTLNLPVVEKWCRYLALKAHFYKAQTYCYFGVDLLSQDKCGDAIRCLQESAKFYRETENLCKEYANTKGPGTQAIPERHAFFRNLGTVIARYAEKCERENGMIYHQKVAVEIPLMDTKAVHGLAVPVDFKVPEPHALWTKESYARFSIDKGVQKKTKDEKPKEVNQPKEVPIPQGDADPKTNSGCVLS